MFRVCDCDLCVVVFEWLSVCGCYVCDVRYAVHGWLWFSVCLICVCCMYPRKCDLCDL